MPAPSPSHDDVVRRLRAACCVFAEDEATLLLSVAGEGAGEGAGLTSMVERRVAGEPLEHIVGFAEFDGLRVAVEPGVFVPRQRTAYLVELAADALAAVAGDSPGTVLDLCCGSGALGLALARRRPGVVLHAADSDARATACAERNLAGVAGRVHLGDLDARVPGDLRGRVDVIVANVPYVPTAAVPLLPPESRDHEPRATVDGGPDGLVLLRRVARTAPAWLRPGGSVWSEVSEAQSGTAVAAFRGAGLTAAVHHDAERDATVVSGRQPMSRS